MPKANSWGMILLTPARYLMNRLSYLQKFIFVSILFLLPIGFLGYGLMVEIDQNLETTKLEQQGLEMMSGAFELIREASEYRDQAIIIRVNNSVEVQTQLEEQGQRVLFLLGKLETSFHAFGDEEINHQLKQVRIGWKQLSSYIAVSDGGPSLQFKYYDNFVRSILVLVDVISYRTKLAHDPNLNTFLLINMLSDDIPVALRELGRARAYGVYALNHDVVDKETYRQLNEIYDDMTNLFHLLSNNMGYAVAENQDFRIPLQKGIDQVISGVVKGRNLMYNQIIIADRHQMLWQTYYRQLTDIHGLTYAFIETLINIADQQLEQRAAVEVEKLAGFIALTLSVFLVIFYLYVGIYFSVHSTLKAFIQRGRGIKQGDYESMIEIDTRDEMKHIANMFNHMLQRLSDQQLEQVEARKMAAIGQMVADISQELNTPVSISLDALSILERQFNSDSPEQQQLILLRKNLEKASGLIRNFKMLSVQTDDNHFEQIELAPFISQTIDSMGLSADQKEYLFIKCQPQLSLSTDPKRLSALLEILVYNAFVHGYGLGLAGKVEVICEDEQDQLLIVVQDHGRGVAEELVDGLFDPSVQLCRHGQSVGLGLHIAYIIVKHVLGGEISYQPLIDEQQNRDMYRDMDKAKALSVTSGARFEILLPKTPQPKNGCDQS
jgi:signal transduction histidine kinase